MGSLREYGRKRDFKKTAEPRPGHAKKPAGKLRYVIQKHAARRLHYDFRLEMEGVLKSWAVPKGIPFAQGEKHLAVHVEDHPLDYADFEGTIPAGEYGGGTVMVWDFGSYTVSGDDPLAALETGKLHLTLEGHKLSGEWTLVRTRSINDKENWLFMKTGKSTRPLSRSADDQSALTGRTMRQIADPAPAHLKAAAKPRVQQNAAVPAFLAPMKPKLMTSLPTGKGWIYELKLDGYRAIAVKNGRHVSLLSRNAKELDFPALAQAVAQLPCKTATLDGEIVVPDEKGRPSFALLQARESGEIPAAATIYYLFDLTHLDGADLRSRPLSERKRLLADLLAQAGPGLLRLSGDLPGTPAQILEKIKAMGLEGLVAKRADSRYEPDRRSGAWIKVKCVNESEFVIGGYTFPKGTRRHFGALLLGYYEGGHLKFAGKVGSGFTEQRLTAMIRDFQPLLVDKCPFSNFPAAEAKHCVWLNPERVCQIRFAEWTRDGKLRQPVFLGLRQDREAREVVRETS